MDGEQLLVYAALANVAVSAGVGLLVWANRRGRADILEIKKALHDVRDMIAGRPTSETVALRMSVLDKDLRLEIAQSEARVAASAVDVAQTAAKVLAAAAAKG